MAPAKITLYVDTISPFAYEAYHILRNDALFSQCEITFVPILLGGLLKVCGNPPPINIKNKATWINTERHRWAKIFDIPLSKSAPPGFPPSTLLTMRALSALTVLHPGQEGQKLLVKALDLLYPAYWVNDTKTYEKEVLTEILARALGNEVTNKVMEMAGKEGKEVLNKNTEQAFANGAFGLPWFMVTNSKGETEGFWGVDHLGQVINHLGYERPTRGGWKAML